MDRDPCPRRIWGDVGGAFAMGCIGGSILHSWKGFRNSPKGDKLVGSVMAVRRHAPTVGGNFAIWGGLFSAFDCGLAAHTEDIYNPIASGFLTGAVLASRGGFKSSMRAGVFGGVLLALIEGAAHILQKFMEQGQHQQMIAAHAAQQQQHHHQAPPPQNEILRDNSKVYQ